MVSEEGSTSPSGKIVSPGSSQHEVPAPSDSWDPSTCNQDEAIREQEKKIEAEIAEKVSQVGNMVALDDLLMEYSMEDHVYRTKILDLKEKYHFIRKCRPDGNCFFRAFGFSLFNHLLQHPSGIDKIINVGLQVRDDLKKNGMSFTIDDFHEEFHDVLTLMKEGVICTTKQLLDQVFNESSKSDFLVVFLRLITSNYLEQNSDFFSAFIEDGISVKEFCKQEVEPMYKESDHIHIIAITSAIGIGVRINYLDRGGSQDKINVHDFPEGNVNPPIHLLYRPGHYDIIYRSDDEVKKVHQGEKRVVQEDFLSSSSCKPTFHPTGDQDARSDSVSSSSSSSTAGVPSSKTIRLDPSSVSSSTGSNPRGGGTTTTNHLTYTDDSNEPNSTS